MNLQPQSSQNTALLNPAQINPVYKNVLEFPQGFDHLKYFGFNPHPDKIPDESLLFAEPFLYPDLNIPLVQKQIEFQRVKEQLWPILSEKEKKLMLLPAKLDEWAMLSNDKYLKVGASHLRDSFLTYYSTPSDDEIRPDIQWIDFKFATDYGHAQEALEDLKKNLLNAAAKTKLEEKLREAGAFGKEKRDFYFWNTDPYNWSDISYQSRSVKHLFIDRFPYTTAAAISFWPIGLIPQYMALGDYSINAIPEGYVQPKGNGEYEICVKKVYLFINDCFNFEDFEYLGSWDLNNDSDELTWGYRPRTPIFNKDFSNFKKHGYGHNFPVLSRLQPVRNFRPHCWDVDYAK